MLAESLVAHVAELLADGRISQRRIARLTGVSRGTVGAIARGRRPLDLRPKCADEDSFRPLGPLPRLRWKRLHALPALPSASTGGDRAH